MATYSTNLGLTLLATGEGAGTWGATTNTNLGTLLEQAISGYTTESLTAATTLTLSIPDGATGNGRNMYIEFTGTGTTVLAPTNKKLYFVYNNCSSGAITFKVAGQTGVSIPNGAKQILVSNGTDIVEATSYITNSASSLTVTNLSCTSATITTLNSSSATVTNLRATSATISNNMKINSTGILITSEVLTVTSTGSGLAAAFKQELGSANAVAAYWNNATSGDNSFVAFGTENTYTVRGTISYNRGAGLTAYNTTSDRRAKTIYGPVTDSGQIVDELKVYECKMNWGTEIYPMMIADEMQIVVPYCVTGQPGAVNPDGSPKYQQVDYTALIPLLIAEIQSLRARVAALGG